jgi:hypothetical protein
MGYKAPSPTTLEISCKLFYIWKTNSYHLDNKVFVGVLMSSMVSSMFHKANYIEA